MRNASTAMAAEKSLGNPLYGCLENKMSIPSEQMALIDIANCLGSFVSTSEPGIADECDTRREAELLMSLMSSPPRLKDEDIEAISSSGSEQSYVSDSSSRREAFTFTCPSLSLQSTRDWQKGECSSSDLLKRPLASIVENTCSYSKDALTPAALFGRRLKVDDRDALRLSADAMARNVLQSFQKAIEWRIQAWIRSLSGFLVMKEKEMKSKNATVDELKQLLGTSEARLIVKLREVSEQITVTGSGTSFRVLPQRVENLETAEPSVKKPRVDLQASDLGEEGDYQYTVAHALTCECVVSLQTTAGFSEVALEIPGKIEGTFLSMDPVGEELTSVLVELNTNILAAMVEKSCRTIVRSSVEVALKSMPRPIPPIRQEEQPVPTAPAMTIPMLTPPLCHSQNGVSPEEVRAALVTPKNLFSEPPSDERFSPRPVLRPIPDDFSGKARGPRRISPQPGSPEMTGSFSFAPRTPSMKNFPGPSLVSPQPVATEYAKLAPKAPSLPMLVEVAVRAMRCS